MEGGVQPSVVFDGGHVSAVLAEPEQRACEAVCGEKGCNRVARGL